MKKALLLLLVWIAFDIAAQDNSLLPEEVRESISKRIEYDHSPSYAIGIIDENGPHYFMFGKTSNSGKTIDEHTIYEIGSISKVFTGILLAHMSTTGKVNIENPVEDYLPDDVSMPSRNGEKITLGHLSDHTSSLTRMPDNFSPADPANPYADYSLPFEPTH